MTGGALAEHESRVRRGASRLDFRRYSTKIALFGCAAALLAACAAPTQTGRALDPQYGVYASPRVTTDERISPDVSRRGHFMVGKPYLVAGRRYVPRADPNYVAVGAASWYGTNFHGRLTANGEVFDTNDITAAHPTMPLPSYARVTNMANGSSIVVRINDRGPFHGGRVIDVSEHAAELLAFKQDGVGKVKVEYLGPAQPFGSDEKMLMATLRTDGSAAPLPSFLNGGRETMVADAAPVPPANVPLPPAPPVELAAYQAPLAEPAAAEPAAAAAEPAAPAPTVTAFAALPATRPVALPPVRPVEAGVMQEMGDDYDTTPFVAPLVKPKAKAKPAAIPLPPERQANAGALIPLSPIRLQVANIVGMSGQPLAYADQGAAATIMAAPLQAYVDAGTFADHAVAEKVMWLLSERANVEMAATMKGGELVWHVRSGPYAADDVAAAAMAQAREAGATGASLLR